MTRKTTSGNVITIHADRPVAALRRLRQEEARLCEENGMRWYYGLYTNDGRRVKARVGRNSGGFYWQVDPKAEDGRHFRGRKRDKFGWITMPYSGGMSDSTVQKELGYHERIELDEVVGGRRANPWGVPEETRTRKAA